VTGPQPLPYPNLASLVLDFPAPSADRCALSHLEDAITYAELRAYVLAMAARLRSIGIQNGDRVALLVENSPEYVISLFAVLALGATAIPLNPETSSGAVRVVLDDCAARGCIVRERTRTRIDPDSFLPVVALLANSFAANRLSLSSKAATEPPAPPKPDSLALLLYTSGTTGRPKGVMLTHANLLANTASIVEYLGLRAGDSTVNVLPFFHSFGNSVLLTHLAVGGSIYIENRFTYPSKVVETLQKVRPTGFAGVPATFYILLHRTPFLQREWSFLRYISQAGGGMRVETIQRLRQAMPATRIYIMYGQTEASARLSYLAPELLEDHAGSIGKAIPGVEIRVVDASGNETAPGQVGELIARGANVMAGYWNDPAATAEAIRDGWLYTGDMARRDADGFLYIVSRKSDFIKSASYRISPVEIEEVIASLGGIEDVAAIGVPDSLLGEAIAACVVCPHERFDAEAIRSQCLAQLPMFKVPRYILRVAEIPRTPSGKKKYYVLRERYQDLEGSSL